MVTAEFNGAERSTRSKRLAEERRSLERQYSCQYSVKKKMLFHTKSIDDETFIIIIVIIIVIVIPSNDSIIMIVL